MSLVDAIRQTMDVRAVSTAEVARRMGEDAHVGTFYRLANGATRDPLLGTFIVLCRTLDVAPTEFLQLAGVWAASEPEHPVDALDLHLRAAFAQARALPPAEQQHAVTLIAALTDAWNAPADGGTAPGAVDSGHDEDAA